MSEAARSHRSAAQGASRSPYRAVLASDATPRCASMASADRQMIGDATLVWRSALAYALHSVHPDPLRATMNTAEKATVYGTEDLLISLCSSVTRVLNVATHSQVHYSGMFQRIGRTCLKPDIGCFVLFDGGFSVLVFLNFSAQAAMDLYANYLLNMGMSKDDLARSYTSDEVSNVMGELMNQVVGDFTGKVRREMQTHITQNQPKMLVLNKQVMLSVDAHLDKPEARRVTFYTGNNHLFYLELAIDRTEFIKLYDFEAQEVPDADALMAQAQPLPPAPPPQAAAPPAGRDDTDALLKSLGM